MPTTKGRPGPPFDDDRVHTDNDRATRSAAEITADLYQQVAPPDQTVSVMHRIDVRAAMFHRTTRSDTLSSAVGEKLDVHSVDHCAASRG